MTDVRLRKLRRAPRWRFDVLRARVELGRHDGPAGPGAGPDARATGLRERVAHSGEYFGGRDPARDRSRRTAGRRGAGAAAPRTRCRPACSSWGSACSMWRTRGTGYRHEGRGADHDAAVRRGGRAPRAGGHRRAATPRCGAVLERLGFGFEGVMRGFMPMDDGPHDYALYAITRDDYEEVKRARWTSNKLTMKSQAALQEAQQQAVARNHQTIEPEHVLFASALRPRGDRLPAAASGRGADQAGCDGRWTRRSTGCPKVYAGGAAAEARISPATAPPAGGRGPRGRRAHRRVHLHRAPPARRCSTAGDSASARILLDAGLTRDGVLAALAEVRGRQRVTDQNPEDDVPGAREVRPRPHRAGAPRQARPGDRPRRGGTPHDPGPVPSHEEQPGPDRRARRRARPRSSRGSRSGSSTVTCRSR